MTRSALALALALVCGAAGAQDRVILRDTKVVTGKVTAANPDGLVVESGDKSSTFGWDLVEAGKVAKQDEFDKLLTDVGEPLFRVRQRLKTGDYRELGDPAEKLFPVFRDRSSGVADTVCQAVALARLARGQREAGVEPFLCCLAIRSAPKFIADPKFQTPGGRKVAVEPNVGAWVELAPVWFDAKAAKDASAKVEARVKAWPAGAAPTAARIYAATLAVAAGDADAATAHETIIARDAADWVLVLNAQREVTAGKPGDAVNRLRNRVLELKEPARMVGIYWVGMGGIASADAPTQKRAAVWLLRLPALYADACPDLAAAGLYHTAKLLDDLKDARGAVAVRSELLTNFAQTYHGAKLAADLAPPDKKGDTPPKDKPLP